VLRIHIIIESPTLKKAIKENIFMDAKESLDDILTKAKNADYI